MSHSESTPNVPEVGILIFLIPEAIVIKRLWMHGTVVKPKKRRHLRRTLDRAHELSLCFYETDYCCDREGMATP